MYNKFTSQRSVFLQSDPNTKESIRKIKFVAQGGFSRVFEGELGTEKTLVAIKIIRKKPLVPWRKAVGRIADSANNHLRSFRKALSRKRELETQVLVQPTESSEDNSVVKSTTKAPGCLSSAEIQLEVDSLRRFQENVFVIQLLGVSNSFSSVWVITELCVGDVRSIMLQMFEDYNLDEEDEQALIVHLLAPILSALLFIHEQGYIHRDIKPSNIILNQQGIPKLIDFGLCVQISPASGTYESKHMSGSPYFMSPEAVKHDPMSTKSDAFSFAATAVHLRTLRISPKAIYSLLWFKWDYIVLMYEQAKAEKEEPGSFKIQHEDPSNQEDLTARCREEYKTLKKYVLEFAEGTVKDCYDSFSLFRSWRRVRKDIVKLISIDVEERGTLQELAGNEFFKQEMIDWKKYPCENTQLSKDFIRLQGFIEAFLQIER